MEKQLDDEWLKDINTLSGWTKYKWKLRRLWSKSGLWKNPLNLGIRRAKLIREMRRYGKNS